MTCNSNRSPFINNIATFVSVGPCDPTDLRESRIKTTVDMVSNEVIAGRWGKLLTMVTELLIKEITWTNTGSPSDRDLSPTDDKIGSTR